MINKNLITALAGILVFGSCSNESAPNAAKERKLSVHTFVCNTSSFTNNSQVTAELLPNERVQLMAPLAGEVLAIYFKEGQHVRQGTPLLKIDDRAWLAQKQGLEASLISAEKDYARKKELLKIEGSSQEEIDNAFSTLESLKAQLKQTNVNISLANVKAPFSGRIGLRNFSKGTYLKQGDMLTSLSDNSKLKVDFSLPQEYQNYLKLGSAVKVLVSGDTLMATIYAINPVIDAASRNLQVRAILTQAEKMQILPGTYAEVLLATETIENAIMVPSQAIVPQINTETVYVVNKGKAKRVVVELGKRTTNMVHVIKGLNKGDTLITTGMLQIKEGMSLQIQSTKN